jgi:hypothetical protein
LKLNIVAVKTPLLRMQPAFLMKMACWSAQQQQQQQ